MAPRELRDEDFDLSSGLVDDFDAVVTDAWFAPPRKEYTEKAGVGESPFLHLKLEGPDLDTPVEQVWSTGTAKQWQVRRDGKEIVSAKNPDTHQFVQSSRAGELVNRVISLAGEGDRARGVQAVRARGYLMTEAEFYIGLDCHWERENRPTVGGEERGVLFPTVFRGFGEALTPKAAKSAFGEDEIGQLAVLASGKTEQQLKQAVMRSDLKGNKELLNAIFNKGLLKELEDQGTLTRGPDSRYI